MSLSFRNYTTGILALLALNLAGIWFQQPAVAAPAALGVLLLETLVLGAVALPAAPFVARHLGGAFLLLCWYATAGAIVYVAADLSSPAVLLLWLTTVGVSVGIFWRRGPLRLWEARGSRPQPTALVDALLVLMIGAGAVGATTMLWAGRTSEAIRSPWETVPSAFFVVCFVTVLALVVLLVRNRSRAGLPAAALVTFVALSATVMVYGIGYGFDQFVHQKVETLILQNGAVFPKTPYYLGQYALVVVAATVSRLPVVALDKLLVPLGYAVLVPLLLVFTVRNAAGDKVPKVAGPTALGALLSLLFPFGAFVATTPTGLAYLFAFAAAASTIAWRAGVLPPAPMLAATAAALATHPLVGIPTLGLALLALAHRQRRDVAAVLQTAGVLLIILGVPAAFLLNAALGGSLQPILANLDRPLSVLRDALRLWPNFDMTGNVLLDLPYLWRAVFPLLLVAAVALAVRAAPSRWRAACAPSITAAALLLPAYLLLGFFQFPEAGDVGAAAFPFRARLIELAALFLLPAAAMGFVIACERLFRFPVSRLATVGVLASVIAANVYVSYPRVDRIEPSKGYAVSASTVAAVEWIERVCGDRYVVLGNQTMAAAAIRHSGFRAYYKGNFYYANPSGSPLLYDYFLKMNAAPTRELALEAMDAVGVNELYFVVHDYWSGRDRIIAAAERSADDVLDVDDGKVMIFVYRR